MKGNVTALELVTKIQEYWISKNRNDNYTEYVILHKHTEGTVINTNDSINATRIMSIRSSKGDGRKVVFILGVTESSLKVLSNNEIGLVYESHFHVSLTRAKNQIYFGLVENNDDIHYRFAKEGYCEYLPKISKKVQIEKINELINKENIIHLLEQNDINFNNIIQFEDEIKQSETVDWGYHCIKYQTYFYQVILNIVDKENIMKKSNNSHLFVALREISRYPIKQLNVNGFYEFLKKHQFKINNDEKMKKFPLCILSNKPEYKKYSDKIKKTIEYVQDSIKQNTLDKLNVYESIILTYMIQIHTSQNYADMTPIDIYNITNLFEQNKNKETELLNNINNVKNIINKSSIKTYVNVNWNVLKKIEMDSNKEYFEIKKLQFPIIGNNKTDIIHIVLKSDMSTLNFWDIMIEILLERFLIYNPNNKKDIKKFKDKKIITYLFLLDKNSYIKLEWDWDKELVNEIKNELKQTLTEHFKSYHNDINKYFNNIKNTNKELWDDKPDEIIDLMLKKLGKNCPDYISDSFKKIEGQIKFAKKYGGDYDICEIINEELNNNLNKHIDSYFND